MGLYVRVVVTVFKAPPSACVMMLWFSRDVSWWGVGVFPPANDSVQVRLREDKTHMTPFRQKEKRRRGGRRQRFTGS